MELDFGALDFAAPHLTLSSSIGNGLTYVSKFLTSKLSGKLEQAQSLLDYLLSLVHHGEVKEQRNVKYSFKYPKEKKKELRYFSVSNMFE